MSGRDSRLYDADLVVEEYASEEPFLARRAALVDYVEGANAEELGLAAIAEAAPRRVLEVGAGTGAFAARVQQEVGGETGEAALARRFAHAERRDADGTVVFPDRAAVERHLRSLVLIPGTEPLERLPHFDGPFRTRSRHAVFVAEKAR